MEYKENIDKSIIEEIFDAKCIEFERYIDKKYNNEIGIINRLLDDIIECCNKNEVPEKVKRVIKNKCEELDSAISKELTFWEKKTYKLGFIDGMRLENDMQDSIGNIGKE